MIIILVIHHLLPPLLHPAFAVPKLRMELPVKEKWQIVQCAGNINNLPNHHLNLNMKKIFASFWIFMLICGSCTNTSKNQKPDQIIASACCTAEATCSGDKYCTACKNCKYCKNCSKNGGSCGVCK